MNNFEEECFAFFEDVLKNRPRNNDGTVAKYCKEDRERILEEFSFQKEKLAFNKDQIPEECYRLLTEIIAGMQGLVEEEFI